MNARIIYALAMGSVLLLTGCAHPIVMSPKLDEINKIEVTKSTKVAAYYISEQDKATEVTTPGGGGDKVKYKPYADIEYGIDRVLSKKYAAVYALKDPNDTNFIKEKNIAFIFYPKLVTNSHSSSAFTWPPTEFTIDLHCVANDGTGKSVWEKSVQGKGNAEFSEFKSNFSLSAERASTQVLQNLLMELNSEQKLQ